MPTERGQRDQPRTFQRAAGLRRERERSRSALRARLDVPAVRGVRDHLVVTARIAAPHGEASSAGRHLSPLQRREVWQLLVFQEPTARALALATHARPLTQDPHEDEGEPRQEGEESQRSPRGARPRPLRAQVPLGGGAMSVAAANATATTHPAMNMGQSSLTAASTSSTWPATFTLGHTFATLPSAPMRNVLRMMPMNFLP